MDGLRPSQSLSVRRASANKLVTLIQSPGTCFLVRANGGFDALFRAFDNIGHDEVSARVYHREFSPFITLLIDLPGFPQGLSRAFATIARFASEDKANAAHFNAKCAQNLLQLLARSAEEQSSADNNGKNGAAAVSGNARSESPATVGGGGDAFQSKSIRSRRKPGAVRAF